MTASTKTWEVFSPGIRGRRAEEVYALTVEAPNELAALDKVAEAIGVTRANRRVRHIPVLGLGSIEVREALRSEEA